MHEWGSSSFVYLPPWRQKKFNFSAQKGTEQALFAAHLSLISGNSGKKVELLLRTDPPLDAQPQNR